MKKLNKDSIVSVLIPHGLVVFGLVLVSLLFYYPLLNGKVLLQSDIRQYEGMSRELKEYRFETGEETYWINNAFGGMPTYQLGAKYPADFLSPIYSFFRILPRPAHILFLYFFGAYILLLVLRIPWYTALFGSLAFGFSTYLLIILQVGHNTKALAISFIPFVLAGLLMLFEKKDFWGFFLTTIALGMQVRANHYQMTYYLLLLMGIFIFFFGLQALRKQTKKSFIRSIGLISLAGILSLGFNASSLLTTSQYTKFSTRGSSELKFKSDGTPKEQSTGLEYDYITEYSYGIFESLNLIVPRIQGGGSSEDLGEDHGVYNFLRERGVGASQSKQFSQNVPTYWGNQPILEAPAYIGISIFFFAILALAFVKGTIRNSLLIGILFSLLLSWGKNIPFLTRFFIDYVPFYNKFRAVSSIQIILESCFPILASLGMHWAIENIKKFSLKRFIKVAIIPLVLLTLLLLSQGMLSFSGANDGYFNEIYGTELVNKIVEARKSIFQSDLLRGILIIFVIISTLLAYKFNKINKSIAITIMISILLFDLLGISNRYISRDESFVSKEFANSAFQITESDRAILKDTTDFRVFEPQLRLTGARTAYFHKTLGGYHGAKPRRFEELFDYYNTHQISGVLNFLNVKYILFPDEESGELKPMRNPNALGSAWFVETLVPNRNADVLLERLKTTDFSKESLFIQDDIPNYISQTFEKDTLSSIVLKKSTPNQLIYSTKSKKEQFAVFSEMYYPDGWSAKIKEQEVPIYSVNYVLRGALIPAGENEIEFNFNPQIVSQGTKLHFVSAFLFLGILLGMGYLQYRTKASV
jgi:hypothetical protein